MEFSFMSPAQIIFGSGVVEKSLGSSVRSLLPKDTPAATVCFIVSGASDRFHHIIKSFQEQNQEISTVQLNLNCKGEVTAELVEAMVEQAVDTGQDIKVVVGIGGGTVIDTSKAIAALLAQKDDRKLLSYLEVVGDGKPLASRPLPVCAVPTTSGTGSECTKNSVILVTQCDQKVSLRSPAMVPSVALVDPLLTVSVPPRVTANTGCDAVCQVVESFVTHLSSPITDALCRAALPRCSWLLTAYQDGSNIVAREHMSFVSLIGGAALANAKLGAVHGFAGVLGGITHAAHGHICAALLEPVWLANVKALSQSDQDCHKIALAKYVEVARLITGNANASAEYGAEWIKSFIQKLGVEPLRLSSRKFAQVVEKSRNSSSMKGNPILLSDEVLENVLYRMTGARLRVGRKVVIDGESEGVIVETDGEFYEVLLSTERNVLADACFNLDDIADPIDINKIKKGDRVLYRDRTWQISKIAFPDSLQVQSVKKRVLLDRLTMVAEPTDPQVPVAIPRRTVGDTLKAAGKSFLDAFK